MEDRDLDKQETGAEENLDLISSKDFWKSKDHINFEFFFRRRMLSR